MTPADVAASYDEIAELWRSDAFPADNGIEAHERALSFVGDMRSALDIGCGGSGRIIELLRTHGFEVEGLDLSPQMLELARARHPDIAFHRADICEWTPPRRYDFISAWDSIWHVPLPAQEPVMRKIMAALEPGGVFIFTLAGLDQPTEKLDAAMGVPMYYSAPGIPRTLALLSEAGCVCRHLEYDQHPELHVFIVAQRTQDTF